MKLAEKLGVARKNIIDGRAFKIPNLDLQRLLNEGVAYGVFEQTQAFGDLTFAIYPRIYRFKNSPSRVIIGKKSYINEDAIFEGAGILSVGHFSSIAWKIIFEFGLNHDHNHHNVGSYGLTHFDWNYPREFLLPQIFYRIDIGSDVWIGRGSILKNTNPEKPLIIGDGAIIASDSVVVKNVPPYAIVGGNPARIIKYRFSDKIIESLLRIRWWDWDIDKIYENFKYFNRVEEFISMHDKGV